MRIYLDQPNQGEPVIKKIREVVLFDESHFGESLADQTILDEVLLDDLDEELELEKLNDK